MANLKDTSVTGTLDVTSNTTLTGDLTVNDGDIIIGGTGRIQGIDTVSESTDAANKAYVDAAVATKIGAANYATSTVGGTLKARLYGTTLYLRNDGTNA